jgi:Threonine synthase
MDYFLKCTACKRKFGKKYGMQICSSCGSLLEVVYIGKMDLGFMRKRAPLLQGIGRFFGVLPDGKYRDYFVGYTPMVKSKMHKNLFMKLELLNPTNSFKDRGSVIEVAKAKEYGYFRSSVRIHREHGLFYSVLFKAIWPKNHGFYKQDCK